MAPWLRLSAVALIIACGPAPPPILPAPAATMPRPFPEELQAAPSTAPPAPAESPPLATLPAEILASSQGPLSFESAAPDGSWVVFCQARLDDDGNGAVAVSVLPHGGLRGDTLKRYLVLASGAEHPIDDLLVSSADGRWAVVTNGGKPFLHDARADGAPLPLDLGAVDLGREPLERAGHRTLAMADDTLFFVRLADNRNELVSRHLTSGQERIEYVSAEPIARFDLLENGNVIALRVAAADTNGNGRFDLPFPPRAEPRPCDGPLPRFRAPRPAADALGIVVLDRTRGSARRVDDLVTPFGKALLRRTSDGALVLDDGERVRAIADSTCAGRLVFGDPERNQLLLGCVSPKNTSRLLVELLHDGGRAPLDIDVAGLSIDEPVRPGQRLVALYPGADAMLFDLARRELHRLSPGDTVLATLGARALVRRGRSLLLYDAETRDAASLSGSVDPFGGVLVNGELVYASPVLVDLRRARSLGSVPGPGLALASSGAVLVPDTPATASSLAQGPLRWRVPK